MIGIRGGHWCIRFVIGEIRKGGGYVHSMPMPTSGARCPCPCQLSVPAHNAVKVFWMTFMVQIRHPFDVLYRKFLRWIYFFRVGLLLIIPKFSVRSTGKAAMGGAMRKWLIGLFFCAVSGGLAG